MITGLKKILNFFRSPKIPGVEGTPNQWSLYEVTCAGLLLYKIQLIEQVIDIDDPLFTDQIMINSKRNSGSKN
jgi:hypothetical protein